MTNLTARDRRAILVGTLVLVPALGFVWGVRPYLSTLSAARDRLDAERSTLARERAELATARRDPDLRRVTDSVLQVMRPRLFEGSDDVIASAQLASYLGDVARRSHVWLQDAGTRPATESVPGIRTLHVDLRAQADFRGLLDFLDALDHGAKLVRIERIDVSRGVPDAANENAEVLTVTATVAGYAQGGRAVESPTRASAPTASKGSSRP